MEVEVVEVLYWSEKMFEGQTVELAADEVVRAAGDGDDEVVSGDSAAGGDVGAGEAQTRRDGARLCW